MPSGSREASDSSAPENSSIDQACAYPKKMTEIEALADDRRQQLLPGLL